MVKIRLLTYNIHKCIGGVDRRYRPERIQSAIRHYEPDIVFLQEVDEGVRRSNRDRQVDLCAGLVGLRHSTFFPNVRVRGGGAYGNAILSRFPLRDARNIDLTMPRRKRRSVLHASCRVPVGKGGRTVHLFNLHLGLFERERQRQLRRFFDSHPLVGLHQRTPVIVGGDFNDHWGSLGKKILAPVGFRSRERAVRTFPAYAPVSSLDAIYVRGDVRIRHYYGSQLGVAKQASDHLPLFAELEIR